jgi:hypothetical protein
MKSIGGSGKFRHRLVMDVREWTLMQIPLGGPAVPGEPEARAKSVAAPINGVMAAIQLLQNRFARRRRRHLT